MTAALVTENLALLASAPSGFQKLRSLVIELAIQGRLVPQDGSAESAGVLLSAISEARAKFYEASSSRPAKVQTKVGDDEQPSALPNGWRWARLGWLAHPQAGFAFKSVGFNQDGRGLPLIRIRDVGQSFSGTFFEGDYRPEFVVDDGDYLVSMDGEFRIAKWCAGKALLNQRVSRLQFFSRALRSDFVALALQARLRELQGAKAYTTVDHLSGGQIADCVIGLPPLEEQQRIVAKVDELMVLCDRLEAEQADADAAHAKLVEALLASLTQARDAADFRASWQQLAEHFHTLFTTEASVDALKQTVMQLGVQGRLCAGAARSTWRLKTINEICTVQGGIQKTPLRAPVKHHFPYLRVANVQRGRIDIAQLERYELAAEELQRWRLNAGDLLIVEGNGSESEIGRCAIWHGEVDDCVYQNHLMRVRPTGDDAVEYLALYLNSPVGTAHMRRLAITTSGLFNLSVGKIRSIPVELPPPAEQRRIVAKVSGLLGLCDQLSQNLATARQSHERLASVLVEQTVA